MFNDPRLVLTIPAEEIEQGAITQIAGVLGIKAMEKLVILPDVHQGYDIPIGTAVVLKNYIWPGAVGYDINCGMLHINTGKTLDQLNIGELEQRVDMLRELKANIPTNHHGKNNNNVDFPDFVNSTGDKKFYDMVMSRMSAQLGTLGGGKMTASSPRE